MKTFVVKIFATGLGALMLLSCTAHVASESRTDSSSQSQRIVPSGVIQESYERAGGIRFDFVKRRLAFSADEVKAIRNVLDKLPDAFLKQVIAGGVSKFYRVDRIPYKPGDLFASSGHESAVAIPPGGFIAFADAAFGGNADLSRVLIHQAAHCITWGESRGNPFASTQFSRISWTGDREPLGLKTFEGFVSDHARTNHREDFAESCVYFWLAPEKLREISPEKFVYLNEKVFGAISPAEVRHDLVDKNYILPVITGLGDKSDEVYSFVEIRGDNFMGPFDGGYNKVRYRGYTANHVPISRMVIWSWVPDVSEGDASITVTTQHGTSNAFPFVVSGDPWWKFW